MVKRRRVDDTPTGARIQHRISIDPRMGHLYEWLASMDAVTRSREVLYLLRLGGEVHLSSRALVLSVERNVAGLPESAKPGHASPAPPNGCSEASAVRSSADRMSAWDLSAMCTPPPRK
jgi:hypothetical protein